jgi:hypothetical protein
VKTRQLRLLLVLAVLCGVFPPTPAAHALPKDGGATEHKYDESRPCDGLGEDTARSYQWTGTGWAPIAGPPGPTGSPHPCL